MKQKKGAIDIKNNFKLQEQSPTESSSGLNLKPIKKMVIKPIGYPLRVVGEGKSPDLTTDDAELFRTYAVDQWNGTLVKKGTFLFDQYMYPDFAFKVIYCEPAEGKISFNTKIILETNKQPLLHRPHKVKFKDIIGQSKAKVKCMIIRKYLNNPKKFGEWAPKNILFYGPPGTGKTMTALALANEAATLIFLVKATDLIGSHVGGGAKRIHQLYKKASELAPCIVFIDELDAIGLDRRFQSIRGDVSEIVNALLSELDGINPNLGIVTIASTNAPALLDNALRSRFEEEIEFTIPNFEERIELLRFYASKLPLKVNMDFEHVARLIEGFSGRDIKEKILKPLLHNAILENRNEITSEAVLKHVRPLINKTNGKTDKNLYA
ncbi:MAG: AAA family ATPase [Candidatus Odinarchaeia archaeon]